MAELPSKLDLRSVDVSDEKREQLLRLFPEIRTEGGKIDFERLKLALGETVDTGRERYGMNWPGKAECFKTVQASSMGTLLPCPEESINFETTQNVIIEGDNLEVLKLMQKSYLGKVKMIYIDPPYNTGNDFIYPDNYSESLQTYLQYTGQTDSDGRRFSTNTDTDGRFHSKWLNMMYPRLYLARNLLAADGLIFVTIDDTESANLRTLLDEVFGQENFVASIAWEKRYTRSNNAEMFYSLKDTILVYRKSDAVSSLREARSDKSRSIYANPDNDPRGPWTSSSYVNPATKEQRKNLAYPIRNPFTGKLVEHPTHAWKYEPSEHERHVRENRLWWGKNGTAKYPRLKNFLGEVGDGIVPVDIWDYELSGTTDEGGLEVKDLFGEAVFDNPKPTRLVERMLSLATGTSSSDLVLDFFAGSGTTAHAVLNMNRLDGGNRRFILVQLPEPLDPNDRRQAVAARFCDSIGVKRNVAEITKERVRRAISKLNMADTSDPRMLPLEVCETPDRGFRVFKLAESNFRPWNPEAIRDTDSLVRQLDLAIDNVRQDRNQDDILYEILLKSGLPLTASVEKLVLDGMVVNSVAGGELLICLESGLSLELVREMAARRPQRVVCLDRGFADNDQLKANAAQVFRDAGVISFRTV